MDKYELVLDIIEHPDKYTSQELEEIMTDQETRDIYRVLCKVDSAIEANRKVDVDAEWRAFSGKTKFRRHNFFMRNSRAASIITIVGTSIVAMAVGIAVTVAVTENKTEAPSPAKTMKVASGMGANESDTTVGGEVTNITVSKPASILFEDEPLSVIMETVCANYGVDFKFGNEEVASLHLYYKFDPSLDLDEVVAQLNTFESINITQEDNLLIID
ncbi:MAG: DUF4974 domain-containing protein [Muribaculaceae bacterium]|nr:DUF4974 domain-containing protein [Muribaculaceae bacterium]